MPGHIGEGLLDGPGQIHKKRTRVGRTTLAQETVDPLVELVMRVQGLPFDEMDEIRPVPRIVGEWIGAGKILDIHVNNVGRGMIETNGAVEAKRLGPASKARDGYMVAEGILDPPQIRRFGSDLELRFEQPLVMAFARTQHHPVFAEGDRLLVLIGGDMPDGENRHCNPMIRLGIACIFRAKNRASVNDDPLSTKLAADE